MCRAGQKSFKVDLCFSFFMPLCGFTTFGCTFLLHICNCTIVVFLFFTNFQIPSKKRKDVFYIWHLKKKIKNFYWLHFLNRVWDFWNENWTKWFTQASFKVSFTPLQVLHKANKRVVFGLRKVRAIPWIHQNDTNWLLKTWGAQKKRS